MRTVWHPDAERLTLAALPAEVPDYDVVTHLEFCPHCRSHVDALRRTVDLTRIGDADVEAVAPPARVWQAIVDELGVPAAQTAPSSNAAPSSNPAPSSNLAPARHGGPRARSRWRSVAVPAAAALLGVAAGLGIGLATGVGSAAVPAPAAGTRVAQLAPLAPAAGTGTVEAVDRDGTRELVVRLDGVVGTADADYLEAWLIDSSGTRLVALGSLAGVGTMFHGSFTVPSDLPTGEYASVDISAEKWDGDPGHSRVSLLRGSLT